ncbi:DUF5715 family protein [Algoriphagus boritolerans]|uniref:DUF5715 family protein n=1 Tax=Algoriphagus boritolerans TaxID=308111 RepID=UPI003A0FC257
MYRLTSLTSALLEKKGGNRAAQKELETVLNEFQAANKIFFIKERKQSCYHVTVR